MFEFLKKLKPKARAEEIAESRNGIDVDALRSAFEAAKVARVERLVAGADDAEILEIEARIESARIAVDRAEVVIADLDRRHTEAVKRERTRAVQADFDAKAEEVREALDAWNREYAALARPLAVLCEQMRRADFIWHNMTHQQIGGRVDCDQSRWPNDFNRTWRGVSLPTTLDFDGCSEEQREGQKLRLSEALRT